jgi:hypothetical protein
MTMDTNLNPSQPSSSGVPSSTTISYHPSAYSPPLNLPSAANSIPGLEFIGFDHKTATHIFKTYDKYTEPFSSPEATNYDFFSFIHGHIIHINNSKFEGHEDTEKLLKLGIREDTIATILDQRFRGVFGTQTLGYWVEDTLKVNYATLLRLQDLDPEDLLAHCTIINTPPKPLGDHTILYKAIASTASLDFESLFLENGTLNISSLRSLRGGDFNGQTSAIYLTPQRQTAEMYCQYLSLRCPFASTFLICLSMPNIFLSCLDTEEVYFSETWKEYTWYCRRKQSLPGHLQYLGKADVVKGHMCTNSSIAKLKVGELEDGIGERDLMVKEDGEKAVQWCSSEERVREVLGEAGGRVHVEVFGPSSCDKD